MSAQLVTVGMDGSVSAFRALDAASAEAHLRGARLDIVCCVRDAEEAGPLLRAARTRVTRQFPHLPVTLYGPVGDPVRLLARASRLSVLTVIGSREGAGALGPSTHSVGRQLAARTHGPLLVVRGRAGLGRAPVNAHPILLTVENDDDTEAAVFAFDEARLRQAPLHIIHPWTYRSPIACTPGSRPPPPPQDTREPLMHCRSAPTGRTAPWHTAQEDDSPGPSPDRAVGRGCLIAATGDAGLVVVTRHPGRHAWSDLRNGPVTDVLLRRSLCPVAVVPRPAA